MVEIIPGPVKRFIGAVGGHVDNGRSGIGLIFLMHMYVSNTFLKCNDALQTFLRSIYIKIFFVW